MESARHQKKDDNFIMDSSHRLRRNRYIYDLQVIIGRYSPWQGIGPISLVAKWLYLARCR